MAFDFVTIKTWVSDNPLAAAGIGVAAAAGIALAVSPKARKMVGLGSAGTHSTTYHRKRKITKKAKSLRLK